jgi:hypothetical protein
MNVLDDVRNAIYSAIVESGRAPELAQLSRRLGLDEHSVAEACCALADAHVIVLRQGSLDIAWAPPFSAVRTPFRVAVATASWYAPCAWDAFGIPAAVKHDADIDARCAWSDEPIACGVKDGRAYGDGVIHLLVPAAHFWDDIGYT